MPFLIDGNNLLHAGGALAEDLPSAAPVAPPGRQQLIHILSQWVKKRAQRATVVFDGPTPRGPLSRQIAGSGVTVVFSGAVSADDVIVDMVAKSNGARHITVVSDDREIVRHVKRLKAKTCSSQTFYTWVMTELRKDGTSSREPMEKRDGLAPGQTDQWLEAFGYDPDRLEPPTHP